MLEIGSKFGGYTVIELLGKGAMGEVYRISNGGADYALKIMSAKSDDAQKVHEWRKRFAREAEAAMKVRHKNLVEVYDVGEDPETRLCYILMEYVGGGTLTDLLKAKGKLEIREAVAITVHVANALSAAHSIGIVHRDIKPDNIMFTSDGVPKLADLGIARWTGSDGETTVTKTEMIVGTPAYMSPEQMLNSHNVDARADIYSLGIVFYEMLTGLRPNQGSTIVELMAKAIKGEELPDVRKLRPEVSAALAYALSRMVAQKAELRPQSAAEAARLVYDAATGKIMVKNPNAGNGERGTDNGELGAGNGEQLRSRMPLILSAVGGLLLAALVAALFLRPDRATQPSVETARVREVVVTNVVNVVREQHDAPLFTAAPGELIVEVARDSKGWNGPGSTDLPERWPVGAGNDSRPIRYIGETEKSMGSAPPTATDMAKTIEIFPRLDRDKKAWAYSFEHLDGWEKPGLDDSKWQRGPGGFGYREYQTDARWASINTEWKTRHIYLRRHFNWNGGAVSRAVLEFFIDDNINVYLNGRQIYYKRGNWIYWEMGEIDPRMFNNALKKGDNVLCVEAENTRAASYVDCGLRVETGGVVKERLGDGERKVQTAAGTWTLLIRNGLVFLGDGRGKALDPEPMGELEIPAELGGLRITELNQNSFRGCGLLKKVTVHEGVRSIRQHAFRDCHALESISLPDSLEWIVHNAFHQTKLKSLNIKNTRLLCSEALDQCALEEITANPGSPTYFVRDGILFDRVRRSLVKCPVSRMDVVLPKGIESICSEAFQWSKIKSVVIPQTVRLIEPGAFHACENLESVEFKCDDARINIAAFKDCTRLKEVILPKNLKFLDDRSIFRNCRNMEEIIIPDTVERIATTLFWGCHKLKRVKIGKRVAFMGQRVFRDCYSIETITLPATLTHMGERVFLNCRSLRSVYFEGDAPQVVEERPFEGANPDLVVYVKRGAKGWTDANGNLPEKWPVGDPDARPVRYIE